MSIMYDWYRGNSESCYLRSAFSSERMLPFSKQMYRETPTASKYNLDENAYDKKMRREMLTENKLVLANMYSGSSETLCKANISARRTKPRFLSITYDIKHFAACQFCWSVNSN